MSGYNRTMSLASYFENLNSVKAAEVSNSSDVAVQKRNRFDRSVVDREKKKIEVSRAPSNLTRSLLYGNHQLYTVYERPNAEPESSTAKKRTIPVQPTQSGVLVIKESS